MSYIKSQLQEVQPNDKGHPLVPVKLKLVSAWGQTNYLTLPPSVYQKVEALLLKELSDEPSH